MTTNDFCNWLAGFLELAKPEILNAAEIKMIKEHLDLSFGKTFPYLGPFTRLGTEQLKAGEKIHNDNMRKLNEERAARGESPVYC